jgi:putative Holliday junction resolvase
MEVYEQDETLSTQDAKNRMLNSPKYNFKIDLQKIDALSAAIILEDFMQNSKID